MKMLAEKPFYEILDVIASSSPAPGGGSVAAMGAAASCALIMMYCRLTIGKERYKESEGLMQKSLESACSTKTILIDLMDDDAKAFNSLMSAYRIPKDDADRATKIEEAVKYAIEIPLKVAEESSRLIDMVCEIIDHGNRNAITDIGVAALFADASLRSAILNIEINLLSVKDQKYKGDVETRVSELEKNRTKVHGLVGHIYETAFKKPLAG